ncbi:MAG: energy transducer TonB [Bacteroidota bacterium]
MEKCKIIADWDREIFQSREKAYGSYQLRKDYPSIMWTALGAGCTLFFLLMTGVYVWDHTTQWVGTNEHMYSKPSLTVCYLPVYRDPTVEKEIEVHLLQQKLILFRDSEAFHVPQPVHVTEGEEIKYTRAIELLKKLPLIEVEEIEEGEEEIPDIIRYTESLHTERMIWDWVPELFNWDSINALILAPYFLQARDCGPMGKVVVRVFIDRNGHYKQHHTLYSDHPMLTRAVDRYIHLLRSEQRIFRNKPIPYTVNIPIKFSLN